MDKDDSVPLLPPLWERGDRPNASDTPWQAGCPRDRGGPPFRELLLHGPRSSCVFSHLFGPELPMSTGSRRDGLGEIKAIVSPAATVIISNCHQCAEMSLPQVGEGGTTSHDEGESVETAVQPRNGKSSQDFAVSQSITAGKVISRPCKSFASVYPGTWVTLGCSAWGHRAVPQPPLTRAAQGAWKPCSNVHLHVGESMVKSLLLPPPHEWRTRLRMEFHPPHLQFRTGCRREWAEAP